jgi:hypothetical protein
MGATTNRSPVLQQGTAGTNTGDVVATISNALDFERFTIHAVTATLDVQVTGDGTNWVTVAVQDAAATASATFVTTLTVGKVGLLTGRFLGVRIRQSGASAANGVLLAG